MLQIDYPVFDYFEKTPVWAGLRNDADVRIYLARMLRQVTVFLALVLQNNQERVF